MRYFAETKRWIELEHDPASTPDWHRRMHTAYLRNLRLYHRHLDKIAGRLGARAHRFFRLGSAETCLHDGFLLSFNMGDNVDLDDRKNCEFTVRPSGPSRQKRH